MKKYYNVGKSFLDMLKVYIYNLEYYSPSEDEKTLINDIKKLIKDGGVDL